MSNVSLSLDNFLEYVPVCEEKANLDTILAIFQSGNYEKIVVVNEQQAPLGIIKCGLIMLYLWQRERVKVTEPPDFDNTELHFPTNKAIETPIEPIEVLSAQMDLREFLAYLQSKNYGVGSDRNVAVVNSEGKFLGLLNNSKILQKLAAQNADLVQLNQLKGELLSSFSHELKSPITAVVGLASLLQEQKLGKLNQRQVRYVKQIYDSGRQLMLLANNILDLMRIEAGQMQLQFKSINIEALCQSAYIEARSSIYVREKEQSKTETKFTLTIEQNFETMVGDELRLRQMLVHLLTNALQATAAGGEIGLKASRWDEWISFMVWDTGVGIPPEIQPLIFQKMQPLQRDLSGPKANGLGLLLTQRLARNHGGDISFTSQVGRGSQFTLFIPANPHRDRHQKKSNRLVLIVESVDRHIASLTEKLLQLGYYFAIARSGTEALLKAEILQPAIILLDPALPQLSGWEVLTLLKSNPNTKNIPTLVTAESNQKQRALQNGAIGFLSLPVQLELLKESLDRFQEERLVRKDSLKILHLCERTKNQTLAGIDRKENFALTLNKYATSHNHRILEADSLEQADIIARVWKLDVLLLDRKELSEPLPYLRSLCQYESLASLPLVTLNSRTTKAANKIGNLSVFPCLIPIKEQNLDKLFQVIEIAASMNPSIE